MKAHYVPILSAAFPPIITVGAFVVPVVTAGIILIEGRLIGKKKPRVAKWGIPFPPDLPGCGGLRVNGM